MSRTISVELAAHLAGNLHTLAMMLRLDMRDGTSIGITDHDKDLAFNLGEGSISYLASTGILPSDVALSAGMDADNFEVSGPISDIFTGAGILGGRFTAARARLFMVNWADLTMGAVRIMGGRVAESKVIGGKFTLEVRGPQDAFNQAIGRLMSPTCGWDYGDGRCTLTKTAYPCAVTAVTDDFRFTVDEVQANDFFNLGSVEFLTGALAGTAPVEVFDQTAGALQLYVPLAQAPEVGDTLNLFRGCSKLRKSDNASLPTCLSYGNVVNFGGQPDVPGTRQYLKTAIPGIPGA